MKTPRWTSFVALMVGALGFTDASAHTVTASVLNVRSGPGFNYRVRTTLTRGTVVNTVRTSGKWTYINRPRSKRGWVYSRYLTSKRPGGGGGSSSRAVRGTFWGTAYKYGRSYRISLVRIDGKAVAAKSARPFLTMRSAAARSGVRIYVVSGFRTMAEQRSLYRRYGYPRAARPGYSNHQSGTAFDLNTAGFGGSVYNWLTRNGWRYAFKRTVSFEPWHWEYMR